MISSSKNYQEFLIFKFYISIFQFRYLHAVIYHTYVLGSMENQSRRLITNTYTAAESTCLFPIIVPIMMRKASSNKIISSLTLLICTRLD